MTLRGFGERYAAVGNIFSGLFCSVSDKPSAFKVCTITATTTAVTGISTAATSTAKCSP
jgi:hypothetical protein